MAVYRAPDQAPKKKSPLGKILLIVLVLLIALAGLAAWTITGEIGGRSADPDQEITVLRDGQTLPYDSIAESK